MTKTFAIVALIIFVLLLYSGLQLTTENFNSLLALDSVVFFKITPVGDAGYRLIFLGEPLHIDPVIAALSKLIPSPGDAIINY